MIILNKDLKIVLLKALKDGFLDINDLLIEKVDYNEMLEDLTSEEKELLLKIARKERNFIDRKIKNK